MGGRGGGLCLSHNCINKLDNTCDNYGHTDLQEALCEREKWKSLSLTCINKLG